MSASGTLGDRPQRARKKSLACLVTDPLLWDVGVAKAAHRTRFRSCELLDLVEMESLVEPRLSGEAEHLLNAPCGHCTLRQGRRLDFSAAKTMITCFSDSLARILGFIVDFS